MSASLPPLTALRAFEAAVRHRSLKKAAEELNVTPAAVSHQIQMLEELLGVRLFRRVHRGIELTASAEIFAPKLQEGFECLRQAVGRLREHRGADVLEVGAPPSFISNWLMPRLHRFVSAYPEVDVRVSTRVRQFSQLPRGVRGDVASVMGWVDEVDVLVVFGNGDYPGTRVDMLLPLTVTPLCSPALLEGPHPLRRPEDLRHHMLLHDDRGVLYEGPSFWEMWLEKAGVEGVDTSRGLHFWHSIPAMEAAVANKGVVATTKELAHLYLSTHRLVAPFPLEVRLASSYHIVSNEPASKREVVKQFREWLKQETRTA